MNSIHFSRKTRQGKNLTVVVQEKGKILLEYTNKLQQHNIKKNRDLFYDRVFYMDNPLPIRVYLKNHIIKEIDILLKNMYPEIPFGADWNGLLPFIDRISAFQSIAFSVAYAEAVEKSMGYTLDIQTRKWRIILLEMERILHHAASIQKILFVEDNKDLSIKWDKVISAVSYIFMKLFENITGRGSIRIGYICFRYKRGYVFFNEQLREMEDLLNDLFYETSKFFNKEKYKIAKLNKKEALFLFYSPYARASGLAEDFRKYDRLYSNIKFSQAKSKEGFLLNRIIIFIKEILSSFRIVKSLSNELKGQVYQREEIKGLSPNEGIYYSFKEGPNGLLGATIISQKGFAPVEVIFLSIYEKRKEIIPFLLRNQDFSNFKSILYSIGVDVGYV